MPSDAVWVAIISAVSALVGGIVGAIASPIGKDWVASRDFDRRAGRDRDQQQAKSAERSADEHRATIRGTLESMAQAMQNYGAEWRGIATHSAAAEEAHKAASAAWSTSRRLEDPTGRQLVDSWKQRFDVADMRYQGGSEPPGHVDLEHLYSAAAEHLGERLRAAGGEANRPDASLPSSEGQRIGASDSE